MGLAGLPLETDSFYGISLLEWSMLQLHQQSQKLFPTVLLQGVQFIKGMRMCQKKMCRCLPFLLRKRCWNRMTQFHLEDLAGDTIQLIDYSLGGVFIAMHRQCSKVIRLYIQSVLIRISLMQRLVGEGGITGDQISCCKHR